MVNLPKANWFTSFFTLNKITRYIATLKASDGGYIKLAQPIELQAGDEVEWIGQMDSSSTNRYLLDGYNSVDRLYLISQSDGSLNTDYGKVSTVTIDGLDAGGITPTDGKVHNVKLTIIGTCYIQYIGSRYNAVEFLDQAFLGLIVRRNGNVIHNISTNVAKGTTIIPNLAQPLGSELWQQANLTFTGTESAFSLVGTAQQNLIVSNAYVFKAEVTGLTSGSLLLQFGSKSYPINSNGITEGLASDVDATQLRVITSSVAPNQGTEVKLSVKEAPHWAEYINVTDDNKEQFTWDAERYAWVGGDTGKILEVAQ
ncbi:hypothetical protein [Pseudoalteromonas sp.]|uniref:hypothetical protein n=1 Tax=Pseudoalteromonas sp. TaxID=53249 RepID=UPI003D10299D